MYIPIRSALVNSNMRQLSQASSSGEDVPQEQSYGTHPAGAKEEIYYLIKHV